MEDKRGYWEGQIAQKLDDLGHDIKELRKDFSIFRQDAYDRINQNSQDITRQKGWMAAIGVMAGAIGTAVGAAIKSLFK